MDILNQLIAEAFVFGAPLMLALYAIVSTFYGEF